MFDLSTLTDVHYPNSLNSRISLRQNVSVNEAISDYSAFEAHPGNVTESAFRPNMWSDQSQVSTSMGQFPSLINVSSGKHNGEGSQSVSMSSRCSMATVLMYVQGSD